MLNKKNRKISLLLLFIVTIPALNAKDILRKTIYLETHTEGVSYRNYLIWDSKNDRNIFRGIPQILTKENSVIKKFAPSPVDSIFILLGDLDSLNRICVIDINRNLDFSDDYVYQFNKHGITPKTNFPAQLISYKRVIDNKEVLKYSFFRPLLFDDYSLKVEPNNELFHKYFVMLSVAERYEGFFQLDNKTYKVVVLGDMYSERMNPQYAIADSALFDIDSLKKKDAFISLREKTLLDNYLIENVTLSENNSTLTFDVKNIERLTKEEQRGNKEGFYALPFQKSDISDINIKLEDFSGKYILLDFWGTWCNPCIKLLPHIASIHKEYPELQIISIAYEMDKKGVEKIPEFIKNYEMDWINIADLQSDKNSINYLYQISSFPTTILIDPTGKIIHRGGSQQMPELEEKLKQAFVEK